MTGTVVAALQLGPSPEGTAATLERILDYEPEISASGARLVVLPEALLGPPETAPGAPSLRNIPAGHQNRSVAAGQPIDDLAVILAKSAE